MERREPFNWPHPPLPFNHHTPHPLPQALRTIQTIIANVVRASGYPLENDTGMLPCTERTSTPPYP